MSTVLLISFFFFSKNDLIKFCVDCIEQRGRNRFAEKETVPASDEDAIAVLLGKHDQFLNLAQSRLIKLQVKFVLSLMIETNTVHLYVIECHTLNVYLITISHGLLKKFMDFWLSLSYKHC